MQLTEKEIVLAENLLSRYEKRTASWGRKRWVLLGLAIIGVCAGAYVAISALADLRRQASYDIVEVIESDKSLTPENVHLWAVGMMVKIAKIFELRQEMLFFMSLDAFTAIATLIICAFFIGIIINRWNDDKRDTIICKILRAKWEDELADKRTDN